MCKLMKMIKKAHIREKYIKMSDFSIFRCYRGRSHITSSLEGAGGGCLQMLIFDYGGRWG